MKNIKKLISSILVISFMLMGMPAISHAAASGICGAYGANVTWTLSDDGTLTIRGIGDMRNNPSYHSIPSEWWQAKNVIIEEGVTSIGDVAFAWLSFKNITIPDSVTKIGKLAFNGHWAMDSIRIPVGVTNIADSAFYGCSVQNIIVDENNPCYMSDDNGVLYNKSKTSLLLYPKNNQRTTFEIPNSVTSIGYGAFCHSDNLASVTIPNSVTSIGYAAFYGCNSLMSLTIPESVTNIDGDAFSSCVSLESVAILDSVTSIGNYAFYSCDSLTSVIIPDSVTSIGDSAFEHCDNLTSVTIGKGVTWIGENAIDPNVTIYGYAGSVAERYARSNGNAFVTIKSTPVPVNVILNGQDIDFDVQPQIINERTMVPVRAIFEALGATVSWDQENKMVTSEKDGKKVILIVDNPLMSVNGKQVELDQPACIIDGRTLVPVRAIAEVFDLKVDWDGNTRTVSIREISSKIAIPD